MGSFNIEWSSFNPVGNEAKYLLDAFQSGWVSSGDYVGKLESELDRIYAGSHSFAVSNGTSALQLAFQLLDTKPGDHVIVPGFSFQAAGNVLSQLGATPVFCDVDSHTWNQTLDTILRSISERTVGIVIVHNYGRAVAIDEIVNWARENGLWVIEDCAEAWFTKYKDKYVGQYGDVATFSMHAAKTIASGEGGITMVNDKSLVRKLKLLRSHGLDRSKVHYLHELPGNNYRLSNLLCAVAYGQLECRVEIEEKQRARKNFYYEELDGHWALSLQCPVQYSDDNVWAVAVRLRSDLLNLSRDELIVKLQEHGIDIRPGFYPASALSYNNVYLVNDFPVSDAISREIIVLPCSSRMTKSDVVYVCDVLKQILDSYRKKSTLYEFVDITTNAEGGNKLQEFLKSLGDGVATFRYFQNRPLDVVKYHLVSVLLVVEGHPIGYGHIELDGSISWLGVAVAERYVGNGWGKLILSYLIAAAMNSSLDRLSLRVDSQNIGAIKLYLNNGFLILQDKSSEDVLHMERVISAMG